MEALDLQNFISKFILLWAVIDPIGTIPVFISATRGHTPDEKRKIAAIANLVAAGILLFFLSVGELLFRAMDVPILAFQIAGGLVLFLFALTMIFGEGKPENEIKMTRSLNETAVFPLATPSIASPGAMLAVVLLTKNSEHTILEQGVTALVMCLVLVFVYLLMRVAGKLYHYIGEAGAGIISRVMGLILASIAAANVLEGIKEYFNV
ncbi:MAG: MarC family protein [Puniceicoccales bacterium]